MSIGTATILSLTWNATLAVFSAALALLVVMQDARRRSNQYFALCMAVFSLYGTVNTAWQVCQQFELNPEPLLYTVTMLYIAATILLFNFVLTFGETPPRFRHIAHVFSVPVGGVFVALVWGGYTYHKLEPLSIGTYRYAITPVGFVGIGILFVYLLSCMALLYRCHSARAQELSLALTPLVIGLGGYAIAPALRTYSFNVMAVTLTVLMMGQLVLKYQVFQPLQDLNSELASKNTQLIEATRLKSQFLANMSHELRTPLNSIIGYAELVLSGTYGDLTTLQADRLQKVTRNGRLLLELINDVLDLSKIEAGRLDLHVSQVPTGELLDSLLNSFEARALEKGLNLVRGYSRLPALWVDENRARQILANLLSNAIKFTEEGAVIVRGHYDGARRQVVISVTDTGIGIDLEHQEHIFEAFHQADSSLTRRYEGTGLGLAIARRLVELHGGRIWFESTVGRGSTFHVALPAAAEEMIPVTSIIEPGARASGPVILAIDDDTEAIEVLQGHLEAAHFQVYGARNANDGIELAHKLKPALITLDIRMPGTDGWQVLETLRHDPETAHIPVLIVTATDDTRVAQFVGADGFITKPVQPRVLLAHIERLLVIPENRQESAG